MQVLLQSNETNEYFMLKPMYIFMIISRSVLLRMRNVSEKVVENVKTNIFYSITFYANFTFPEIKWINMAEPESPHMTIT